ncbi:uncharacterized protein At5g39865-like [Andrographis paniculata]|uniref:uncharacterized protein At5g39865-like n=1 Tax=Andrographis paniculata TaxID=175694 RepID=UPI0021E76CB9|nr:uncharacterized protein At5g39865-like [Andrographis paniculata]
MGCTASRSANFITHRQDSASNSPPSPRPTLSDPSSPPVARAQSLPTPLVHHPPLKKGDSNHFVALTSTTYGSIVIVDSPNPRSSGHDLPIPSAAIGTGKPHNFEDPLSPDSVINTWELMEGLNDEDDDEFNYHIVDSPAPIMESYDIVDHPVVKSLWKHLSDESIAGPATFSDHLNTHPRGFRKLEEMPAESINPAGAEDRIILYYTSLRGIRKTYEECCAVRAIFRGFRVIVDERDISMDRSYRIELQEALKGRVFGLPRAFINGKCVGGAEEIKEMNESGELARLLEAFPTIDLGCVCENCGDARFVPCSNCNGSRKIYRETEVAARECPECNENGLVRCSGCGH